MDHASVLVDGVAQFAEFLRPGALGRPRRSGRPGGVECRRSVTTFRPGSWTGWQRKRLWGPETPVKNRLECLQSVAGVPRADRHGLRRTIEGVVVNVQQSGHGD